MGKSKEPIFYEKTKTQSKLPLFHISIFLAVRQKFLDLCACFVNNGLRFGSVWNCLFPFPGCHELQEIAACLFRHAAGTAKRFLCNLRVAQFCSDTPHHNVGVRGNRLLLLIARLVINTEEQLRDVLCTGASYQYHSFRRRNKS